MRKTKRRLLFGAILALSQLLGICAPALISADDSNTVAIPASAPDLIIETISWLPATPAIGDKVTFSVTVKNQGDSHAVASNVAGYLDDTYQTSAYVEALASGATATVAFTWTAQAGSHTIKAIADHNNSVTESDEVNNAKTFAFPVLAPDLIVEAITWSPGNPSVGDAVSFTVTIKNHGSIRAGCSNVDFYIDGNSKGYRDVLGIEAGANVTKTFNWVAQAGSHTIKAVADVLNQVNEGDETNNDKAVTYSTSAPDLIIQGITWSPKSPSEGSTVTFTVTIKNQGIGKADHSRIACYVDDNFQTSVFVSPIDTGDSTKANFTWTGAPGLHTIKAVADSENRIIESDETNNSKTVSLPTLASDLIIQGITQSPKSASAGDAVTFTVTVKNQGKSLAGYSLVYFYVDGSNRLQHALGGLDAGATMTVTFHWTARVSSHTIKVVADGENYVNESNETNNTKTITVAFSSSPLPDFTVQDIVWSPENPLTGDTVTFSITIKNRGSGQVGAFYVACYIDGFCQTSAYVNQINAGGTSTMTFPWVTQAGSHTIKAVADSNSVIAESDETNNEKAVALSVSAPDLIIQGITWSPKSPPVGDTITFTVTIKNQGNIRASRSYVAYYIDGSSTGYHDTQAIDAGATVTRTFSWTAQAGSHTIRVVADKDGQVPELNERNNERIVLLPAPDLIVEAITWSPENPSEDDDVTFTISMRNHSVSKAGYSSISLYIDDSATGLEYVQEVEAGATVTRTFSWTAQAGSHTIKAIADGEDKITESDESNNDKAVTLSVSLPPAPAPAPAPVPGTIKVLADSPKEEPGVNLDNKNSHVSAGQDKAPAAKQLSTSSSKKELGLKWWLIIGAVVLAGIAIVVKLKFRQRSRNIGNS